MEARVETARPASRRLRLRQACCAAIFGVVAGVAFLRAHAGVARAAADVGEGAPRGRWAAPPAARLVVLFVVDQLRADDLDCRPGTFTGGFARLCREGRRYSQASFAYGLTETASGHATLGTGVQPAVHGILDKRLYDPERRRLVDVCRYPAVDGRSPGPAAALRVPTLGERLRAARPGAQVVSVAAKDRSANLLAGTDASLVAWVGAGDPPRLLGRQESRAGLPAWLLAHWAAAPAARPFAGWPAPPGLALADAVPADEVRDCGHGPRFPHLLSPDAAPRTRHDAWLASPQSDAAVLALALAARAHLRLGGGAAPALLLVSLGATDRLGHCFGPAGPERRAILAALDRALGEALVALRAAVPEGLVVALTADHGMMPRQRQAAAAGHATGTLSSAEVDALVAGPLRPYAKCAPEPVAAMRYPFLFLRAPTPTLRAAMARDAAAALRLHPSVQAAWSADELLSDPAPLARRMAASWAPGRGGDVVLLLRPYHLPVAEAGPVTGSRHGSPYTYDRHVPLVLWGDGVAPGQIEAPVDVVQLTRTLGDVLGIGPAEAATPGLPGALGPP